MKAMLRSLVLVGVAAAIALWALSVPVLADVWPPGFVAVGAGW